MTKTIYIGHNTYRRTVRSGRLRDKLRIVPEVRVEGKRVVFPGWMKSSIERLVERKVKRERVQQEEMRI